MDTAKLKEHIIRIRNLRAESYLEAQVKQSIVIPILECLGWDIYDPKEVELEHGMGYGNVDYALWWKEAPLVFIEAKKAGEKLKLHTEQLIRYAWSKAVPIVILTNGLNWRFYLSWEKRDWPERKFCSINVKTDDIDNICNNFILFLSKEKVISGEAERVAKEKLGHADIQKAMLKAWNELIDEPNPILIDLVAQITKKICPNHPDIEIEFVKTFMAKNKQNLLLTDLIQPDTKVTNTEIFKSGDNKAWYYWKDRNGKGYILRFVNQHNSCSMRRFDAESGRFLNKHPTNPHGDYQVNFAEFIKAERRLYLSKFINMKSCKEILPNWAISEFRQQIKDILSQEHDKKN